MWLTAKKIDTGDLVIRIINVFNIAVIRMLRDLVEKITTGMKDGIFQQWYGCIKNEILEMKNIISKLRNSLNGIFNSRSVTCDFRLIERIQMETKKEKKNWVFVIIEWYQMDEHTCN